MGLSNYQLVLLDNLIYLNEVMNVQENRTTIGDVVHNLLYDPDSGEIGEGAIKNDCRNPYNGKGNCLMSKEEWIAVLLAIEADPVLCALTIYKTSDPNNNDNMDGFRAMVLTGGHVDENIIIFRGTMSAQEWMDDAAGGYSVSTEKQGQAV